MASETGDWFLGIFSNRVVKEVGFRRSINPISTKGGILRPPHYYLPTQLWLASYFPYPELDDAGGAGGLEGQ